MAGADSKRGRGQTKGAGKGPKKADFLTKLGGLMWTWTPGTVLIRRDEHDEGIPLDGSLLEGTCWAVVKVGRTGALTYPGWSVLHAPSGLAGGHARTKRLAKMLAQELAASVPGCENMDAREIAEHANTLLPIINRYRW